MSAQGEAQMEDARTSTSSKRDIPVSVQELVYGSKTARVGPSPKSLDRHHELISSSEQVHRTRKDRGTSEGLDTHVLQRGSTTDKSLVENPKHVIRGPEEKVCPRKAKQTSGSSPSLHKQNSASKSAKEAQENPKDQPEGKEKGKGKGKPKWNKPYMQNYRIPKKENTAMDNVFNMARTLMEFKNKEEERLNQSFPNK
ncbi:hypothetical protein O181_102591 [Austropuccinia psidii MF-1]|uniref:Uncharacterized protein n=1 Tax=Austropuccinia psidii MF-1 TaxID=1389203 RepID=A0A9Q3JJ13_9BASI|nr:hypothetical protein [Austropuccinia psidii MF-1]